MDKGFFIVLACFFALLFITREGFSYPGYCPGGTADCVSCHGVPYCTQCPTDLSCGTTPVNYTINASVGGGGGSISPSGAISVTVGNNQSFTITPTSGYEINDVLVDGSSVGPQTFYTFLGVTANHTISATFFQPTGTPPLADFSATPMTTTEPYIVKFTDLSTNGPTSWIWDFDDGGSSSQQNPYHVFRSPGTYVVTLKAASRNGSNTISANIDASFGPCPNAPVDLGGWRQMSIQSAYDSASSGDVIKMQAVDFEENLIFDANTAVTLRGGYDCNYTINPGATIIPGSLSISNGSLTAENVVIRSTSSTANGVLLYAQNCENCHLALEVTTKAGRSAADIQAAIDSNLGGMGVLSFLTPNEVQAIADVLPQGGNPGPDYSDCTLCHGQPPSGSSFPDMAGAHAVHTALASVGITCTICHQGAAHNSQVDLGISSDFNAQSGPAVNNLNGTCSSVRCHGGQTTPDWYSGSIAVNTQCTFCHTRRTTGDSFPDQYNDYYSGEHRRHVVSEGYACTVCHNTSSLQNGHFLDLQSSVFEQAPAATIGGGSTRVGSYSGGRCSNIQCHSSRNW
jgi:predicted CxxxxCH...CXXCH cytochrome family protein